MGGGAVPPPLFALWFLCDSYEFGDKPLMSGISVTKAPPPP